MDRVFVHWDNSNVFHEARRLAEEREGTPGARYLIHTHFENLLRLAEAGRPLAKAVAAGSVPPEISRAPLRCLHPGGRPGEVPASGHLRTAMAAPRIQPDPPAETTASESVHDGDGDGDGDGAAPLRLPARLSPPRDSTMQARTGKSAERPSVADSPRMPVLRRS